MTDTTERWLPVPRYEGFYEVSDLGQIRSVLHMTSRGPRGGKLLAQFPDKDGYLRVNLSRIGVTRSIPVHVLVLRTFAGEPEPGQEGRHGPNGKRDNRLTELCWGTRLENAEDKRRDGTMARGERQGNASLTEDAIREIRRRRAAGELQQALADAFGISQAHVSRIELRQTWTHVT